MCIQFSYDACQWPMGLSRIIEPTAPHSTQHPPCQLHCVFSMYDRFYLLSSHCSILLLASHFYSSLMINITYENEKLLTFNIIYIIHLQQWILLEILLNSLRYCECVPGIMGHNFSSHQQLWRGTALFFFVAKKRKVEFHLFINAGD